MSLGLILREVRTGAKIGSFLQFLLGDKRKPSGLCVQGKK